MALKGDNHGLIIAVGILFLGIVFMFIGLLGGSWSIQYFYDIGLAVFLFGASSYAASKTLIEQDKSNKKIDQRLDSIERKIDMILNKN